MVTLWSVDRERPGRVGGGERLVERLGVVAVELEVHTYPSALMLRAKQS
jgi:hypothetical protein